MTGREVATMDRPEMRVAGRSVTNILDSPGDGARAITSYVINPNFEQAE